jgi:hypothetical protein
MEQAVLKPHNLPEQLRISASDMTGQEVPSISDLFAQECVYDPLVNEILKATTQADSVKDITVAECTEQSGQGWYRGKRYVPEDDHFRLRLIKDHHDPVLAGHPGRAMTFDLLDRQYY